MTALAVGIGAALGSLTRYLVGRITPAWPTILIVNTAGSFGLGALAATAPDRLVMGGIGTGFCGALTTMSSLALLASEATRWRRVWILGISLGAGLIAATAGWWLVCATGGL